MIPVCISLKNRNVLIVGGGKVALRKAELFLREEANITVISKIFEKEFDDLSVNCITDKYQHKYLKDMFVVYAATNSREVNLQIVHDCQQLNILCGNAHNSDESSFHSMAFLQNDLGLIAFSSYSKLPYSKPLVYEMMITLEENREKVELLEKLRPYIIQYSQNVKECYKGLYNCDIKTLSSVYHDFMEGNYEKYKDLL